jgi:hypothetical protein
MPNEFKIKNGFFSEGSSNITGSLSVTAGITGSLLGTSSFATQALSSSFSATASFALSGGTIYERKHDFDPPYDYCGIAPSGTLESAPNWTITRLTIDLDGTSLNQTATGEWDDRTTLIYT